MSLEDEKKPQPLQFSFTLYDLDGHGKITKDDIAGIVSTIYESIGKSVVVPHYGSKTINVRLTVSPDSKTRPSPVPSTKAERLAATTRRRHRTHKLISDEEDCSDTSEMGVSKSKEAHRLSKDCSTTTGTTTTSGTTESAGDTVKTASKTKEELYETIKCCNEKRASGEQCCLIDMNGSCTEMPKNNEIDLMCKECTMDPCPFDIAMQKSVARKRMLRKSRSRKQKNADRENVKPRARSLSVGNEISWKENQDQTPCWKSPLRRHELIEIIRESMEKNRLCFQANR